MEGISNYQINQGIATQYVFLSHLLCLLWVFNLATQIRGLCRYVSEYFPKNSLFTCIEADVDSNSLAATSGLLKENLRWISPTCQHSSYNPITTTHSHCCEETASEECKTTGDETLGVWVCAGTQCSIQVHCHCHRWGGVYVRYVKC